ncbi:MAG: cytochrome P450 [Rubricella sp.]
MTLPDFRQDPREPEFVRNPYSAFARLRTLGDLVFWQEMGMPVAARHGVVNALLRDRRFGRENPFPEPVPERLKPFYDIEAHSMLELEPPRHTRLRGLVVRAFTSRRVAAMRADIEAIAREAAAALEPGVDLVRAVCEPIPVRVICRLLGVPEADAPDLLTWSHDMVAMYQVRRDRAVEDRAVAAATAFARYMRDHIERRRGAPGDDLISTLIAAEENGARLTTDELVTTCILLLNAGHEATVHGLANGLHAITARGLTERARQADPDALTEEVLRFEPPLHFFARYAMEDVTVFGHRFARGDRVGLLLGSANRDERVFANADRFDPGRTTGPQIAFGAGAHFCVGAPLARLEIAIALPILLREIGGLSPAPESRWADTWHFRCLERLILC